MKQLFISLLLTCIMSLSLAQQSGYKHALGVKVPVGFSLTYKNFVTNSHSIEGMFTIWNEGVKVTGLYEFNHYPFLAVERLGWFIGPGASMSIRNNEHNENGNFDLEINGIIGLDYKFKDIPLNLSIDWQPGISILGTGFNSSGGIGIRFTF